MALQKDYDIKGVIAVAAYHKIKQLVIDNMGAIIKISVYKNEASANDPANEITEKHYTVININGGDQNYTDYLLTVHATDNVMERAETYLMDKVADYAGAVVI